VKRHLLGTAATVAVVTCLAFVTTAEVMARMGPREGPFRPNSDTSQQTDEKPTAATDDIVIRVNGRQIVIPRDEAREIIQEFIQRSDTDLSVISGLDAARTDEMPRGDTITEDDRRGDTSKTTEPAELPRAGIGSVIASAASLGALSYGVYSFLRSRRYIQETKGKQS
jgi:hypothetical protein